MWRWNWKHFAAGLQNRNNLLQLKIAL
jgi:hypothetical protein